MTRTLCCLGVMSALLILAGCGKSDTSADPHGDPPAEENAAHVHATEGPHGGHLIELSESYCAELATDEDAHSVTIYLLDEQDQPTTNIEAKDVVVSVFTEGAFADFAFTPAGTPGVFSLTNEILCQLFDHDTDVKARVKVTISGQELVGRYEQDAHAQQAEESHEH